MFIPRESRRPFLALDHHGHNLRIEPPRCNRPRRASLRRQCEFVLLLARNLVLLRQYLSRLPHHHLRQRTKKSVTIHPIHHFLIPQTVSPPRPIEIIRNPRHRFRPPRENAIRIAKQNRLISQRNRLHPRSASLVDGVRRNFHRHSAAHRNLPRHVGPTPSLPRVAKYGLVNLSRLNPRPLHRRLGGDHAHVRRRERSERPPKLPNRRPHRRKNIDSLQTAPPNIRV